MKEDNNNDASDMIKFIQAGKVQPILEDTVEWEISLTEKPYKFSSLWGPRGNYKDKDDRRTREQPGV